MKAPNTLRSIAPNVPADIIWHAHGGIYMIAKKADANALLAAGVLSHEEVPEVRPRCARNLQQVRVTRCEDGSVNLRIKADLLMRRSRGFKQFLGGLLADTRLSLVRGERHV